MHLGIDFGTCYSSAALLVDGALRRVKEPLNHGYAFPSSVCLSKQGDLLVGQAAEARRLLSPDRYRRELKRYLGNEVPLLLGDRQFRVEELVGKILARIKVEAEKMTGSTLDEAVVTVPATFSSYKRGFIEKSARQAGFASVSFLEEPVAAALYYVHQGMGSQALTSGDIVLVYDLGGGTFDAALLQKKGESFELLAQPVGDERCGGVDFDREIYKDLSVECAETLGPLLDPSRQDTEAIRARLTLNDWCRDFKHQLSEETEYENLVPVGGGDLYVLSRQKFEEKIAPFIAKTVELCQQLVSSANLTWDRVDRILMVGGSCRVPYVKQTLERKSNRTVVSVDEPELAVCLGAALKQYPTEGKSLTQDNILAKFRFEVVTVNRTGKIIKREEKQARYFSEDLGGGIALEMVEIPAGAFVMGSPNSEPRRSNSEGPQHKVTVPEFYLGKYPITQAQWRAVAALPRVERDLDLDPSKFTGANRPVEQVSWYDAVEFCRRLSRKTGRDYRLPTEAEWEYACRAGTETPFHFGETISTEVANYDGKYAYGNGPEGEYRQATTEVGRFPANCWGLHDMHGNVWEWCADPWHGNYDGAPTDGSAWLESGSESARLLRGGSWDVFPAICRSACRVSFSRDGRVNFFGFRVCCDAPRTLGP